MWEFIIPAAASVISGAMGSQAAGDAADAQAAGAKYAADLQKQIYEDIVRRSQPWYGGGVQAQNALLAMMGLQPDYTATNEAAGLGGNSNALKSMQAGGGTGMPEGVVWELQGGHQESDPNRWIATMPYDVARDRGQNQPGPREAPQEAPPATPAVPGWFDASGYAARTGVDPAKAYEHWQASGQARPYMQDGRWESGLAKNIYGSPAMRRSNALMALRGR